MAKKKNRRRPKRVAGGPFGEIRGPVSPALSVKDSIEKSAARLGLEVPVPASDADAWFVMEDLRHRERLARRAASGSAG